MRSRAAVALLLKLERKGPTVSTNDEACKWGAGAS